MDFICAFRTLPPHLLLSSLKTLMNSIKIAFFEFHLEDFLFVCFISNKENEWSLGSVENEVLILSCVAQKSSTISLTFASVTISLNSIVSRAIQRVRSFCSVRGIESLLMMSLTFSSSRIWASSENFGCIKCLAYAENMPISSLEKMLYWLLRRY